MGNSTRSVVDVSGDEGGQRALVKGGRNRAKVTLTTTSWSPHSELPVDEWVAQGRRLGAISRGVGWWIGDWLRYGNERFGERYVRAARITGYDVQTLMNMVYVASRFEGSRRREGLSFSHHAEVAALEPEARDRWLAHAETEGLSVRCLREELRQERRLLNGGAKRRALPSGGNGERQDLVCPECGCQIDRARAERRLRLVTAGDSA
jgi:hypothetical protein